MSASTKAKRQASVSRKAPKAKAQPAKPKATRKPRVVEVEQPEESTMSKTDVRRETYAAIEDGAENKKPLTLAQVNERFGAYGMSRLAKSLLKGDYTVPGVPQPKKPIDSNDRTARAEWINSLLGKYGKSKIEVVKKFRRRQTA